MALPIHDPSVLAPALRRPFALFVNLHGTIAPIAPRPEEAEVAEPARRALAGVVGALDVVAVVSGASAEEAQRLVGVDGILYLGFHGCERLGPAGARGGVASPDERLAEAARAAIRRVGDRGLLIEPKGEGIGIHFRGAKNPRTARKQLFAALQAGEQANRYRLVEGRCLIELRPIDQRDKGDAVAAVLAERGIKGAIYVGDDRSDIPAFRAVQRLRAAGGFGVAVGVANDEAREVIAERADFLVVDGIPGVVRILTWLTATLGRVPAAR
jgi:trehalose 6-phosphate phosphatase